jgi:hypothetical protein
MLCKLSCVPAESCADIFSIVYTPVILMIKPQPLYVLAYSNVLYFVCLNALNNCCNCRLKSGESILVFFLPVCCNL